MHEAESSKTWREMLGEIIQEPKERGRLSAHLGVNPTTLMRWAANTSNPRMHEIRALLSVLPDKQPLLRELLGADAAELAGTAALLAGISRQPGAGVRDLVIPTNFYAETLRASRDAPQRFWTISSLILSQMLAQLDPQRLGIEIVIAQCMPARDGKVRSLRDRVGLGTPPWPGYLEEKTLFMGAESLGGYVVAHGHWVAIPDVRQPESFLPVKEAPFEVSLAAFPILLEGNIAGCILASSTQTGYFAGERLQLLDDYADLLRLAFCDMEFYPTSTIELGIMPPWVVQQQYFVSFRQRVAAVMREARLSERVVDALAAEQVVRTQLEQELLEREKGDTHDNIATIPFSV